jgi:hypothetical protein
MISTTCNSKKSPPLTDLLLTAVQKQILPPYQHWETKNNRKVLVAVDPETNNRFIALHWSVPNSDIMTIFKTGINLVTQEVMVLIDRGLSAYHSDEIECSNPDGLITVF